MDFGRVLSRAWQITWRWKALWVLGFLAALGSGGGGGSSNVNFSGDAGEWAGRHGMQISPELVGVLIGVGCLALIVGIVFWVLSLIGRGGLIAGVEQVEQEENMTLGQAWRAGVSRFWTLFGLSVLAGLPIFILILAVVIAAVIMVAGGIVLGQSFDSGAPAWVVLSLVCFGSLCCVAIPVGIVFEQIRVYGERAAMLEGLGWIDAFKRGWEVLKANLGTTIILWLLFLVIGMILFGLIFGAMLGLSLPLVGIFSQVDPGAWVLVPICFGGILALIVGALVGAIVQTFTSATWTLAFREMTGMAAKVEVEAETA